jgi:hypothetical protein
VALATVPSDGVGEAGGANDFPPSGATAFYLDGITFRAES